MVVVDAQRQMDEGIETQHPCDDIVVVGGDGGGVVVAW